MKHEIVKEVLSRVTLEELCQIEEIEEDTIVSIVEFGIAVPMKEVSHELWVFDTTEAHWIKRAVRIQQDLEIDWVAVAMIIELLQQKEKLEFENQRIRHQLRRFIE